MSLVLIIELLKAGNHGRRDPQRMVQTAGKKQYQQACALQRDAAPQEQEGDDGEDRARTMGQAAKRFFDRFPPPALEEMRKEH